MATSAASRSAASAAAKDAPTRPAARAIAVPVTSYSLGMFAAKRGQPLASWTVINTAIS